MVKHSLAQFPAITSLSHIHQPGVGCARGGRCVQVSVPQSSTGLGAAVNLSAENESTLAVTGAITTLSTGLLLGPRSSHTCGVPAGFATRCKTKPTSLSDQNCYVNGCQPICYRWSCSLTKVHRCTISIAEQSTSVAWPIFAWTKGCNATSQTLVENEEFVFFWLA